MTSAQLKSQLKEEVSVESYSLENLAVGDRAIGWGQRIRASKHQGDGFFITLASGAMVFQINVTGTAGKVFLEDVLAIANRMVARSRS